MNKSLLLIFSLATWRISNMLVNEDGPWLIFEHLRLKLGLQPALGPVVRQTEPPNQMPGSLFSCVWCISVWVAGFWLSLLLISQRVARWIALPFAFSAIACLLDEWGHR